ncbi:MAG: sensor domain-containing diguanylate cyclase [Gemmatimonadota bacterium]|jgi:diguanylate cyclase (GGDEF)-like protein
MHAPLPSDEAQRLQSLHALGILDTAPEERFDRLTRIARRFFRVPIALVSLVDADRQWFKSRNGLEDEELPREYSFCAYAILDSDHVMVVRDARSDERFSSNPLVTGSPEIRFYAGCPVKAPDGSALGTLCVIDHEPRDLEADDATVLTDLAELVENEIRSLALATTDDLTDLANRRGFEAIAVHTLAVCLRVEKPATLLLFDLDEFKNVNDTLGHAVGDQVLRKFSKHLLSTFRDSDVVARLGGDEFCVLLSGAGTSDIDRPLTELRELMGEDDGGATTTFSVGAATYDPDRHRTIADLLIQADEDMYADKRGA